MLLQTTLLLSSSSLSQKRPGSPMQQKLSNSYTVNLPSSTMFLPVSRKEPLVLDMGPSQTLPRKEDVRSNQVAFLRPTPIHLLQISTPKDPSAAPFHLVSPVNSVKSVT